MPVSVAASLDSTFSGKAGQHTAQWPQIVEDFDRKVVSAVVSLARAIIGSRYP